MTTKIFILIIFVWGGGEGEGVEEGVYDGFYDNCWYEKGVFESFFMSILLKLFEVHY